MYARHFGLRENPFPAGHQLRFLYPSREHQEARAHLRYGIENREPFVLITGEVGTGKTTALYDALAEWGAQVSVALITNSALTRQELLEEICLRFGVPLPADATKPKMLSLLERHLSGVRSRGEHAVLLLDEAQNLAVDLLEEIRLLSNVELQGEKLMQIILVGQPELEAKLARPELRQLRQRITVHYRLNPLSPEETAGYIHHRISVAGGNAWGIFPPDSCREVFRVTHGIPREINTVASQAMVTAFSENAPAVTVEHVQLAAQEGDFRSVLGPGDLKLPTASELAAALRTQPEPPAEAAPAPPAPVPAAAPTPMAAPVPPPAPVSAQAPPPAPERPPVSPHLDAPPAWTPERAEQGVEPVLKEELDAWSAAAGELLKARQRQRDEAPSRAAQAYARVDAPMEPFAAPQTEPLAAPLGALIGEPEAPRYPEPVELHPAAMESRSDASAFPVLPQRLREKLEAEMAEERERPAALPWMIGIAAIALVLVAAVLAQRFGAIDLPLLRGVSGQAAPADHASATTAQQELPVLSSPAPVIRDSSAATAMPQATVPAPSGARENVQPASAAPREAAPVKPAVTPAAPPAVAAKPAATPTATAAPPKPATMNIYGIAVGNFLDESRAGQENARLADLTGLAGRVMTYDDNGTTMYRVVLGNFTDEPSAERAADRVLSRPGVREARVIVLARNVPKP